MTARRSPRLLWVVLRAVALGLVLMIVLPLGAALGVLAAGHLAGACGPGSAGRCEMAAAQVGLYTIIPAYVIGVAIALFHDLRMRRA
ncbi:hypothetical protein [Pararhodobacter sp. SW119]|uniref:hypothetical protein n=1 Tax=Pararhodobacter sp. SW119 TaxID=2780075 RepID=UPI001ADFC954|nr:hypothetical protein [Pararhodobacter sp. SW119]